MDSLSQLIALLAAKLKQRQWQLVTAESCTGGLVAARVTEIPGSSSWFERGFVTYSNLAKQEMLGVPEQLIQEHGAVSEQVAVAMALGALQYSAGHAALSVTGVAGPDGGSAAKPVGTVCFAWATKDNKVHSEKKLFTGDRQEIRRVACRYALEGIYSLL